MIFYSKQKAFTLVETIVVIGLFTILALGLNTLFIHIFKTSQNNLSTMDNIDHVDSIVMTFNQEIRSATIGTDGSFPFNQANDTSLIFFSNYRQASNTVAEIHYYLANNILYKNGTALLENVPNDNPLFSYYDQNYTGSSTPLTQPIDVSQIKYVTLNLNNAQ